MLKLKGVGGKRLLGDMDSAHDIKRPLLGGGISKRIQDVLGDRLSATPTLELQQQDTTVASDNSTLPQNGHAAEPLNEDHGPSEQT